MSISEYPSIKRIRREKVGNDGLTISERNYYLDQFNRGIGAAPSRERIARARARAEARIRANNAGRVQ